jgi:paraquat-inducible protein A
MRCGTVLIKGRKPGPDRTLVFSVTGLVLALPAAFLPLISVGLLGDERISRLFTGEGRLWDSGMRALAILVFLCGGLLPLLLLGALALLRAPARLCSPKMDIRLLIRIARLLEHWAIPEVQVLAVLVALMKLGGVVDITIGPGFWCYCGMALSLLIAQRSFEFDSTDPVSTIPESAASASS